jgi:UDP-N-acetylmuramoyl-L-alanyl-D-glutamate--2,6-diaminopimelate ligase
MNTFDTESIKLFSKLSNGHIDNIVPGSAFHIPKLLKYELNQCQHSNQTHPSKNLFVIGVTGTNGKTSVSYLIGEVLKAAGYNTFVLGTLNSGNSELSTPEAIDILRIMKTHLAHGGTHFVMEVTSEGIDQERIIGIDFNVKLLTNITQDHLDYHKTFENYKNTKLGFMREGSSHKVYPEFFKKESIGFSTLLLGHFNLLNVKAAVSVLRYCNISEKYIRKTLSTCSAPKGRLQNVDKGQSFIVLIDFAHTPDGLQNVLSTVKNIALNRSGRLLVLFGCGGNRDRDKRAKMGKIASNIADFLVITDDNPRFEDREQITSEILSGIEDEFQDFVVIQDRKTAIEFIINNAEDNDVVILAGKGHETYQVLKAKKIHFDDHEEASNAISIHLKMKAKNYHRSSMGIQTTSKISRVNSTCKKNLN